MARLPLLFLPGLICDERLWRDQADGLADIAAPMIADLTRDDSIEAMAQRALAAAPDQFALCALSMGGYVAFEIMRSAPERVTRLALLSTSARLDDPARAAQRKAGFKALKLGRFLGVTDRLLPQLVHPSHLNDDVGATVKAMAARVGGDAYVRQQRAILGRQDAMPLLPRIAVPTLIGVGEQDVLTPVAESETIQRGISGARLHRFADCGHLPPLEKPAETTRLLRSWLLEPLGAAGDCLQS